MLLCTIIQLKYYNFNNPKRVETFWISDILTAKLYIMLMCILLIFLIYFSNNKFKNLQFFLKYLLFDG